MVIKILGTGCPRCKALEEAARTAASELNIEANFEKVEDIVDIMNYGVMHTPGLVIDEKVILTGRVPSVNELKDLLIKHSSN